jgi:hypothetical protein
MPTLTDFDLTDPAPPVPGDAERAAVRARAARIVRRRRTEKAAGAFVAVAIVALMAVAVTSSGSGGPAPAALLRVRSASLEQDATVTVTLRNDDGSFEGTADANRMVHFDPPAPPGTYRVFVTVESPQGNSGDPAVDIGTAVETYEPLTLTLHDGTNVIDLDQLTPEAPTSTPVH